MYKVKATKLGYYEHNRRKEGSVFKLRDREDFSPIWMNLIEGKEEVSFETKDEFLKAYPNKPGKKVNPKPVKIEKVEETLDNNSEVI